MNIETGTSTIKNNNVFNCKSWRVILKWFRLLLITECCGSLHEPPSVSCVRTQTGRCVVLHQTGRCVVVHHSSQLKHIYFRWAVIDNLQHIPKIYFQFNLPTIGLWITDWRPPAARWPAPGHRCSHPRPHNLNELLNWFLKLLSAEVLRHECGWFVSDEILYVSAVGIGFL